MAENSKSMVPSIDVMLSMSGLEYVQKIVAGKLPGPPLADTLNFRITDAREGETTFHGSPQAAHCNVMGGVHGGWYGAVLDSCMGLCVMTKTPKGFLHTTLEYKINLTRSIPLGTEIVAKGWLNHSGRTTGVACGEIRGVEDGKLYASGSTTCLIYQPKS